MLGVAAENQVTVNISDARISRSPDGQIITYALGSCLGLTVYDPVSRVGGILHCLLPLSNQMPDRAKQEPYMFVDTGVPKFLNDFFAHGGDAKRMIVKAAGCGNMQDEKNHFNIGQRNLTVLRKILWKNNIVLAGEVVGGSNAKTLILRVSDGQTCVKMGAEIKVF